MNTRFIILFKPIIRSLESTGALSPDRTVVLVDGGSVSEKDVIDFCRDQMGGFERPRSVDFIEVLPRNASGKVLKRELREPYWVGHGRRVAGS